MTGFPPLPTPACCDRPAPGSLWPPGTGAPWVTFLSATAGLKRFIYALHDCRETFARVCPVRSYGRMRGAADANGAPTVTRAAQREAGRSPAPAAAGDGDRRWC